MLFGAAVCVIYVLYLEIVDVENENDSMKIQNE